MKVVHHDEEYIPCVPGGPHPPPRPPLQAAGPAEGGGEGPQVLLRVRDCVRDRVRASVHGEVYTAVRGEVRDEVRYKVLEDGGTEADTAVRSGQKWGGVSNEHSLSELRVIGTKG